MDCCGLLAAGGLSLRLCSLHFAAKGNATFTLPYSLVIILGSPFDARSVAPSSAIGAPQVSHEIITLKKKTDSKFL